MDSKLQDSLRDLRFDFSSKEQNSWMTWKINRKIRDELCIAIGLLLLGQLICNQQVDGSNPSAGSILILALK